MVVSEALGAANCGGVPMAIGADRHVYPALARFGSDALRKEFLAPAIAGDMVGCIGVSEVGGGSDVAALKTTARSEGDDYVINGWKMWITNAMQADWCCLLANTSEGPVHSNKSLIIVPMDAKGITKQKIKKIGHECVGHGSDLFDNVRVPKRNLIGTEGTGLAMQMLQFQEERLYGAANSLKMLDRLIDQTIEYTRERHTLVNLDQQPGHPLPYGRIAHRGGGPAFLGLPRGGGVVGWQG